MERGRVLGWACNAQSLQLGLKQKVHPQVLQQQRGLTILAGSNQVCPWLVFHFLLLTAVKEQGHHKLGKHICEAISTGAQFRTCGGIHHSIDTLCWHLEAYDMEMDSICLKRAACKVSVKELEEALKGELSTNKEEMAHELAEEEVQR